MKRICLTALTVLFALSSALAAVSPLLAADSGQIVGQHTVVKGETLYCIGRGYKVVPSAIAQANGLSANAKLSIGQVLNIPAVEWISIPPGPICIPQFQSPFVITTPTPTAATSTPGSTATSTPAPPGGTYVAQWGDTLFRIARKFGVTVDAIKAANSLKSDLIHAGQVLVINCPNGCIAPPVGCVVKGNVSFNTGEKIYHVPGGEFYDQTIVRPAYGERWFCAESEAIANGWRKSQR